MSSCALIPNAPLRVYAILSCEAAERLCYYGVRAVLVLFLLSLGFDEPQAIALNSYWIALCYFSPLLGAVLADAAWGRFTTILVFTALYACGMALLAAGAHLASRGASFAGLFLVALGAGGIKPCVGPFGADQLPKTHSLTSYWLFFYVAINLGSLLAYFAVPLLRASYGFTAALALPAASMGLSAAIFLFPSASYARVPAEGSALLGVWRVLLAALRSSASRPGAGAALASSSAAPGSSSSSSSSGEDSESVPLVRAAAAAAASAAASWLDRARGAPGVTEEALATTQSLANLLPFYLLLPFFWAVYDAHSSIGLLQARRMDLCFGALGCIAADQVAVLNPLLVVTLIPLIDRFVLPALHARAPPWLRPTPLRRMCLGMFLAALSFLMTALVQAAIEGGARPHVALQVPQYIVLTLAEVGVSATGLEFFYSQAPTSARAVVLAGFFVTTALGDLLNGVLYTALGGRVSMGVLIWIVTALCLAASCVFAALARRYKVVGGEGE